MLQYILTICIHVRVYLPGEVMYTLAYNAWLPATSMHGNQK